MRDPVEFVHENGETLTPLEGDALVAVLDDDPAWSRVSKRQAKRVRAKGKPKRRKPAEPDEGREADGQGDDEQPLDDVLPDPEG